MARRVRASGQVAFEVRTLPPGMAHHEVERIARVALERGVDLQRRDYAPVAYS